MNPDSQLHFTQATDSLDFAKEHHYSCHVVTLIDEKDDGMDKKLGWCSVIHKSPIWLAAVHLECPTAVGILTKHVHTFFQIIYRNSRKR